MGFRFTLSRAQIGPETGARPFPTAVLRIPVSPRRNETQQVTRAAPLSPQPAAILRDRLTHSFPHSRSLAPMRGAAPGEMARVGRCLSMITGHEFPFRSPRRAHVGRANASAQIALRGSQQTRPDSIALVTTAQCARDTARHRRGGMARVRQLPTESAPGEVASLVGGRYGLHPTDCPARGSPSQC